MYSPPPVIRPWPGREHYDCFISYTTREEEVREVKPLIDEYCAQLRARGVRPWVWYDGWMLRRSRRPNWLLRLILRNAIRASHATVAFVSPQYFDSDWCEYEVQTTARLDHPAQTFQWKGNYNSDAPPRTDSPCTFLNRQPWYNLPEHVRYGNLRRFDNADLASECARTTINFLRIGSRPIRGRQF
jgi:hypothetical protein